METLNLDNLDFSELGNTKGLLKVFRQAHSSEITTAILSSLSLAQFQKKEKLSKAEKKSIIDSVEENFEELISTQLKAQYGDEIQRHF